VGLDVNDDSYFMCDVDNDDDYDNNNNNDNDNPHNNNDHNNNHNKDHVDNHNHRNNIDNNTNGNHESHKMKLNDRNTASPTLVSDNISQPNLLDMSSDNISQDMYANIDEYDEYGNHDNHSITWM
jgi:hypothetical protein